MLTYLVLLPHLLTYLPSSVVPYLPSPHPPTSLWLTYPKYLPHLLSLLDYYLPIYLVSLMTITTFLP